MPFIIANESFEKVAGYGLLANMILYLMSEYHFSAASGANILFLWNAASNFTPMLGAFLSDSYLGRFLVIALGSLISFLGITMLWSTAFFRNTRPPACDILKEHCLPSTIAQRVLLYCSFIVMSIGAGGIRPCSIAFGADQIDNPEDPKNQLVLQSFFNWYYASVGISVMLSVTVIVYIQDKAGWVIGFGVPLGLLFLAAVLFLIGSPFYVKVKGNKSLFTGFAQVVAAAFKNRRLALPPKNSECDGQYYHGKDSKVIAPTERLRFINKACLIRSPEKDLDSNGLAIDPWKLCTVKQVEALKALIKVLPIWSTGIMAAVNINQSFPVIQVSSMDRRFIGSLKIPAGSFSVFGLLTLTIWVAIYDRILAPFLAGLTGHPRGLSLKQRMGIGLVLTTVAMAVSALVERKRRALAIYEGFANNPRGVTTMTAMWAVPQHCLLGLAEAFNAIGQIEFYYSQFTKDMSSIAVALIMFGMGVGGLAGSLIVTIVDKVTKRGGNVSWVDSNVNKGHYDYYYWVLTCMSLINFLYYLVCSWAYGSCEESNIWSDEDRDANEEETDRKHNGTPTLSHV
ncbi:protein NRT1/ PTR FAMILY 1.2-like isoform X2 [Punica granatum]|nr:protein NRT1/ PTR FAMILY 1.2-like isoform X2 [Punica granatum]